MTLNKDERIRLAVFDLVMDSHDSREEGGPPKITGKGIAALASL
jgi:hypothetical protein